MKDIGKIFLYLLGTVFVGALLAPLLFWIAQSLGSHLENARLVALLTETDFQRFFNRAVLVAAFALLWPLVRALRIRNLGEDIGLRRERRPWRRLGTGFAIAMASLALLGTCLIACEIYYIKGNIPWSRIAWLPLTAFTVAIIEEVLFRGAIQGVVQRTATDFFGIFSVAFLFSAIHFLKPPENAVAATQVHWWSGFALVPQAFWQFEQPGLLFGGFTTIFIVGLILGYARCRTRSLWMPIGLHAGWIFGKMSFSKITKRTAEAWPWFGSDMLVGFGPVLILLATGLVVWFWLRDEPV
ncbi:MAG: protease family protein [Chthoniobacter sp.]|nr:protease family protein [Chthoniobacter sp.]